MSRNLLVSVSSGLRDLGQGSPRLKELYLSHNQLTGPEQLLSLRHVGRGLCTLDISHNKFKTDLSVVRRAVIIECGPDLDLLDGLAVTNAERREALEHEAQVLQALLPPPVAPGRVEQLSSENSLLKTAVSRANEEIKKVYQHIEALQEVGRVH